MKSANNTAAESLKGEWLSYWLKQKRARQKKKKKKESVGVRTMRTHQRSCQAAAEQLIGAPDARFCVIKHPTQLVHSQVGINQSQLINFFFRNDLYLCCFGTSARSHSLPCEAFVYSAVGQNLKEKTAEERKMYGFH